MSAGIPANTYWAVPQRVLAGPHPEFVEGGLQRLLDVGVRRFVDLTARGESYERVRRSRALYVRRPIDDLGVPSEDEMREILGDLTSGDVVYVHCRYGLGRTGTAVGCLLVEQGTPAATRCDGCRSCGRAVPTRTERRPRTTSSATSSSAGRLRRLAVTGRTAPAGTSR